MKFRKKPIIVEAEQLLPRNPAPKGTEYIIEKDDTEGRWVINTLEGQMTVLYGDWVITGVKGEKYPCKPDIFEATYEKVIE